MAVSFKGDLRLSWWLRRRQLAPRYWFWLLLLGYDIRERSKSDFLYVPYLVIFWGIWGLIVAFGVAGFLAERLLASGAPGTPTLILFFAGALALWLLW